MSPSDRMGETQRVLEQALSLGASFVLCFLYTSRNLPFWQLRFSTQPASWLER